VIATDSNFITSLQERAKARHAKIGIGIRNPSADLINKLKAASEYAELLLVGDACSDCSLENVTTDDPASKLADLLYNGEIDGAVRGNVSAYKAMNALSIRFKVKVRRMVLLELKGWAFFLAPVGISEGETLSDKINIVMDGAAYLQRMGISPSISILSGGRLEDAGRSERVDKSLAEAEFVASGACAKGMKAMHRGILIESCIGDDLILAPDGITGNLIFRTLMLLCGVDSLGAPVLMDKVFVDSSRARDDFTGPVMLASAMVGMNEDSDWQS
jgi:putative methanogen marker protein 4